MWVFVLACTISGVEILKKENPVQVKKDGDVLVFVTRPLSTIINTLIWMKFNRDYSKKLYRLCPDYFQWLTNIKNALPLSPPLLLNTNNNNGDGHDADYSGQKTKQNDKKMCPKRF